MDQDYTYWTIEAMKKYGGSFVKALAELAARSDGPNLVKIRSTWPEYWGDYEQKGQQMRFDACAEGLCDGSGELADDVTDADGNIEKGTGTRECPHKV